jgi:hypothetical protein
MPAGTLLLQPQKVQRAASILNDRDLIGDSADLFARISFDEGSGGGAIELIGLSFEASALRIATRSGDKITALRKRLLTPFQSFGASFEAIVNDLSGGDAVKIAQEFEKGLAAFARALANLTPDQIRTNLAKLMGILRDELGVTEEFLEAEVWAIFDDAAKRLEQAPALQTQELIDNRKEIAALLRRIRRMLFGLFVMPTIDTDRLAGEIVKAMERAGLNQIAQEIAAVGEGLSDIVAAGMTLTDAISLRVQARVQVNGGTPPGGNGKDTPPDPAPADPAAPAAGSTTESKGKYLWYASSVLGGDDTDLFGGGDFKEDHPLAAKLKAAADPVSVYLKGKCSDDLRMLLDSYSGSGKPSDELTRRLTYDLNVLVKGDNIYDATAFANVTLDSDTKKALDDTSAKDEDERWLLNRMLLEDAYPAEIDKKSRNWFVKKFKLLFGVIKDALQYPGDNVFIETDGKWLLQEDRPLFVTATAGSTVDWTKAPEFDAHSEQINKYTFQHFSAETADTATWLSSWLQLSAKGIWDGVKIFTEDGKRISNVGSSLYYGANATLNGVAHKPLNGYDFFSSKFLAWQYGGHVIAVLPGTFPGYHTNANFWRGLMYWFKRVGDAASGKAIEDLPDWIHDGWQDFMTLFNYSGPEYKEGDGEDKRPKNREKLDGIVGPFILLFAYALATAVPKKEYTGLITLSGKNKAIWLAGGAGMGLLAGLCGTVVAAIIAWAEDWPLLGKTMAKSALKLVIKFPTFLGEINEGDTSNGTYNPNGGDFKGYPKKASAPSPYKLPFEAGKSVPCLQGNQGDGSHNFVAAHKSTPFFGDPDQFIGPSLVYAYDFALDQDEEVLASRAGTVVAFLDTVDDGESDDFTFNFIRIRHDVDNAGAAITPDTVHDLDVGGPAVTFAEYRHGRQGSITGLFGAGAVGKKVKQGQVIMKAGTSGVSTFSCNQVHIHVVAAKPGTSGAGALPGDQYTIPFVFQDVDGDGVCKKMDWYTSGNTKAA